MDAIQFRYCVIRASPFRTSVQSVVSLVFPIVVSIRVHSWLNGTSLTASYEGQIRELCGIEKSMRIFLIGMPVGVMLTAAFTYVFAIPANSYHWQMEICKRGDAAWTDDKNGHAGWKWMVEPIPADVPRQKPVIAAAICGKSS